MIKYAAPVAGAAVGAYAGPIGAVMGAKYAKDLAGQIKLMEEYNKGGIDPRPPTGKQGSRHRGQAKESK